MDPQGNGEDRGIRGQQARKQPGADGLKVDQSAFDRREPMIDPSQFALDLFLMRQFVRPYAALRKFGQIWGRVVKGA
jgi:hypothetical protein